jgi:site-specific DNA-cytosine methylase
MLDFLAIYGKNNREINSSIISHFMQKPVEYATFAYQNANYIVSQKRDRFFLFAADKETEKSFGRFGDRLSFFDGNITQDEFLTDIKRLLPLLDRGQTDHSDIFGIYCYGEVCESGQNHIHRDVLGNYPLFIAYNDNLTAISNNPYLAAQALYGQDWRLHINIYALSNIVVCGRLKNSRQFICK